MILLSFGSAAKYILSLLLAILGIIPYEAVGPSDDDKPDSTQLVRTLEQPLAEMKSIPFNEEAAIPGMLPISEEIALIPLRDSHPIESLNLPECRLVEANSMTIPFCEYTLEVTGEKELIKKVTLLYGEKLEHLLDKEVRIISTGLSQ